ncbi:hypothetical protein [Spiroplasma endosymbiont of Othius punctulatus]|uniref:hypothetical protein n=1 Tax=Spiroplasma endosymbiont of Othius punctulatus TaxID=3066289 RepID=UPI0030D0117E
MKKLLITAAATSLLVSGSISSLNVNKNYEANTNEKVNDIHAKATRENELGGTVRYISETGVTIDVNQAYRNTTVDYGKEYTQNAKIFWVPLGKKMNDALYMIQAFNKKNDVTYINKQTESHTRNISFHSSEVRIYDVDRHPVNWNLWEVNKIMTSLYDHTLEQGLNRYLGEVKVALVDWSGTTYFTWAVSGYVNPTGFNSWAKVSLLNLEGFTIGKVG